MPHKSGYKSQKQGIREGQAETQRAGQYGGWEGTRELAPASSHGQGPEARWWLCSGPGQGRGWNRGRLRRRSTESGSRGKKRKDRKKYPKRKTKDRLGKVTCGKGRDTVSHIHETLANQEKGQLQWRGTKVVSRKFTNAGRSRKKTTSVISLEMPPKTGRHPAPESARVKPRTLGWGCPPSTTGRGRKPSAQARCPGHVSPLWGARAAGAAAATEWRGGLALP